MCVLLAPCAKAVVMASSTVALSYPPVPSAMTGIMTPTWKRGACRKGMAAYAASMSMQEGHGSICGIMNVQEGHGSICVEGGGGGGGGGVRAGRMSEAAARACRRPGQHVYPGRAERQNATVTPPRAAC